MKLFLLKRIDDVNYDEFVEKLIRAKDEKRARELANQEVGDEGKLWDTDKVSCDEVFYDGEEEILITDFNAG